MDAHAEKDSSWKEIGWNGIRFRAPSHWEPASIGNRYLMLEDDVAPVLELKWSPIKGAFSHRKNLRRLAGSFRRQSGIRIEEHPLPADWKKTLQTYEHSGFLWTGKRVRGRGAILYCPACKNATLIQFYAHEAPESDRVCLEVLRSFKDHPVNGQTVWAVFDIRAVIPDTFFLTYHRFEPGRLELSFRSGRHQLTLYRWGPADAALSNRTLVQFAQTMIPVLQDPDRYHIRDCGERADFDCLGKETYWQRLRRKPTALKVRIWHEAKRNKIMGIRLEGAASDAGGILDTLSGRYETL